MGETRSELYWSIWNHPRATHELKLKLDRLVFTDAELEGILRQLNAARVKKGAGNRTGNGGTGNALI